MKNRLLRSCIALVLVFAMLPGTVLAADWPQFLGEANAQGVSAAQSATSAENLALRWEKNSGNTWYDVPGTPIVVGEHVYYYSSQYLRKIDLATGKEVAKVQIYGEPVNQFFINIAYGEGKIFVPCQTNNMNDGTGVTGCFLRVFDANTLKQLYVTESMGSGQMQSPVMYHDGYVVTGTYGRNGTYAGFTTEDEDPSRSDEVKPISWSVSCGNKYGFSFNGAAFVNNWCYFGNGSTLYIVNYKTGEVRTHDIGEGHIICSTITYSTETDRLYVSSNHPTGGASVVSYALNTNGMPKATSAKEWVSHTENGGTQSSPVVYNGRLYIGGGGSTMGSAETFHVVDAVTMKEIYSVPIMTKGTAAISTAYATEENDHTVYIYLVPFAPNQQDHSELWILMDREGQTKADYEVIDNIGRAQYCSQSVAIASDGSLLWYNDAGRLYCYENTAGIFSDTKNHWAREEIAFLARNKVINGYGNNLFLPNKTVTRAHFAQILANMSGDDFSKYTTDVFADVKPGDWCAPAIAWAVKQGIVTEAENYFPDEPITRQDMALMLYRYVRNVAKATLPKINPAVTFTDQKEISTDAATAVASMQQSGIINGKTDGDGFRFAPLEKATRAHAAAMIARFYRALNEQD